MTDLVTDSAETLAEALDGDFRVVRVAQVQRALDAARAAGAAEALREAADQVGPALANEVGGHTSTCSVRRWLRDRAALAEKGGDRG